MKAILVSQYFKIILYVIAGAIIIIIGCDSPSDINRQGDKLDGYITYTDTNLLLHHGFYSVSVYNADSTYPFNRVPIRTDSLTGLYVENVRYKAMYSLDDIPDGRIYVAATWSKYPRVPHEIPIVLGIYGCDTSSACTQYEVILYPNTQGNFRNIWAWTDTTKKLN